MSGPGRAKARMNASCMFEVSVRRGLPPPFVFSLLTLDHELWATGMTNDSPNPGFDRRRLLAAGAAVSLGILLGIGIVLFLKQHTSDVPESWLRGKQPDPAAEHEEPEARAL